MLEGLSETCLPGLGPQMCNLCDPVSFRRVGWLVGQLAGWLDWPAGRQAGCLAGWLADVAAHINLLSAGLAPAMGLAALDLAPSLALSP